MNIERTYKVAEQRDSIEGCKLMVLDTSLADLPKEAAARRVIERDRPL
jgi:hypothetical protein